MERREKGGREDTYSREMQQHEEEEEEWCRKCGNGSTLVWSGLCWISIEVDWMCGCVDWEGDCLLVYSICINYLPADRGGGTFIEYHHIIGRLRYVEEQTTPNQP